MGQGCIENLCHLKKIINDLIFQSLILPPPGKNSTPQPPQIKNKML